MVKPRPIPNYINSHTYKVSMLIMPKTGYTTINHSLGETSRDREPMYRSFAVVREPLNRILSSYHEALRRGTHSGDLLSALIRIKQEGHFDNHMQPMIEYFEPVDKVFVFPSFQTIAEWIGNEIPYHMNRTEKRQDTWTVDSVRLFEEIYEEDITFFNDIMSDFPSIQDCFFDIYQNQDPNFQGPTKYRLAEEEFTANYQLKPPFKDYRSFMSAQTRKLGKK